MDSTWEALEQPSEMQGEIRKNTQIQTKKEKESTPLAGIAILALENLANILFEQEFEHHGKTQ